MFCTQPTPEDVSEGRVESQCSRRGPASRWCVVHVGEAETEGQGICVGTRLPLCSGSSSRPLRGWLGDPIAWVLS